MVLGLYVAQLLVPVVILLDLAWAWHDGYFRSQGSVGKTEIAAAAGAVLWLALGVRGLLSRDRQAFLKSASNILLSLYVTIGMLLMGELAGSYLHAQAQSRRHFLRHPGSTLVRVADPQTTPGSSGRKRFTVNEMGLRGPSAPKDTHVYRIIAIGGSTTECYFLDDSEEWPHRLMDVVNQHNQGAKVWVANAGFSGHSTVHTLALLQTAPALKKADLLICMVGINDLQATLEREGLATDEPLAAAARRFLDGGPPSEEAARQPHVPIVLRSNLVKSARSLVVRFAGRSDAGQPESDVEAEQWYRPLRQQREKADRVPLPDLRVGIEEYRSRIGRIGQTCHSLGVRCMFVTQPTLWRSDLNAREESLLWFGWVGLRSKPRGYVGSADLAAAMALYNQALQDTCAGNGFECFDLAALIPQDTSALFDDCHFNEQGAKLVADELARHLLRFPPFEKSAEKTSARGEIAARLR